LCYPSIGRSGRVPSHAMSLEKNDTLELEKISANRGKKVKTKR